MDQKHADSAAGRKASQQGLEAGSWSWGWGPLGQTGYSGPRLPVASEQEDRGNRGRLHNTPQQDPTVRHACQVWADLPTFQKLPSAQPHVGKMGVGPGQRRSAHLAQGRKQPLPGSLSSEFPCIYMFLFNLQTLWQGYF